MVDLELISIQCQGSKITYFDFQFPIFHHCPEYIILDKGDLLIFLSLMPLCTCSLSNVNIYWACYRLSCNSKSIMCISLYMNKLCRMQAQRNMLGVKATFNSNFLNKFLKVIFKFSKAFFTKDCLHSCFLF
jgi:hypothetical protein